MGLLGGVRQEERWISEVPTHFADGTELEVLSFFPNRRDLSQTVAMKIHANYSIKNENDPGDHQDVYETSMLRELTSFEISHLPHVDHENRDTAQQGNKTNGPNVLHDVEDSDHGRGYHQSRSNSVMTSVQNDPVFVDSDAVRNISAAESLIHVRFDASKLHHTNKAYDEVYVERNAYGQVHETHFSNENENIYSNVVFPGDSALFKSTEAEYFWADFRTQAMRISAALPKLKTLGLDIIEPIDKKTVISEHERSFVHPFAGDDLLHDAAEIFRDEQTPSLSWICENRVCLDLCFQHHVTQVIMDETLRNINSPYKFWKTVVSSMRRQTGVKSIVLQVQMCPGHTLFYKNEIIACSLCREPRPETNSYSGPTLPWFKLSGRLESVLRTKILCRKMYSYFHPGMTYPLSS
ncbi:hypothetical protein BWQ96_10261 [Gracilariopsis chorda]|uniref:Uncharacterized protein n=1 Tax=Gracilariopsis chorda TaxID=448386 RepID=A0A2V3ID81_9FLOR|nr:hypothetical protein BWQ96_10261 [Gracilariopsis chorda]|eukprot:PXF40027.1 hypothetical protein BWQ96_10261 [Gracilariopsis chorda]